MRIVTVVGARPQFVKAAAVSRALRSRPGVEEVLIHTGQHYDDKLSRVFFDELEIPEPDYHLGIGSASHGEQTGRMLASIESVLLDVRPDWTLVLGDTNSTLAGALAAVKLHIPVAHIEAGVRSFNRRMPEEINRILTDQASELLLAPTRSAVEQLYREGIDSQRVRLVGDVMYDVILRFARIAEARSTILDSLALQRHGYVVATVHRAENTDDPRRLSAIFTALSQLALELPVVVPLHPRTRHAIERPGATNIARAANHRLHLIDPIGYFDMAQLQHDARLVVTDSGGLQKEAYFHGVPCVTLRRETEWTELVASGTQRLAEPTDADSLFAALRAALAAAVPFTPDPTLFGEGRAAERIADALIDFNPLG